MTKKIVSLGEFLAMKKKEEYKMRLISTLVILWMLMVIVWKMPEVIINLKLLTGDFNNICYPETRMQSNI